MVNNNVLICSSCRAGVLYMFNDAHQKLPNMAIALFECKGARRAAKSTRPHCFELLLKTGFMQLAAPDEYVASEWLQALVQAASGVSSIERRCRMVENFIVFLSSSVIRDARKAQNTRMYVGADIESFDHIERRFHCTVETRKCGHKWNYVAAERTKCECS